MRNRKLALSHHLILGNVSDGGDTKIIFYCCDTKRQKSFEEKRKITELALLVSCPHKSSKDAPKLVICQFNSVNNNSRQTTVLETFTNVMVYHIFYDG